jgi:protein ImuA
MKEALQKDIVRELQKHILAMQGAHKPFNDRRSMGLGPIEAAFPEGIFPTGAVHELVSMEAEAAAATSGFLACLLNRMMTRKGFCLWVSSRRLLFPPALKWMGIDPECIIFVDLKSDKDVLWAVEEALRCDALVAVVGELKELTFAQSRRLQLAIEQSRVTGFIHRIQPRTENPTACAARWKIYPLPGIVEAGMPGVGFPKWNVELTKVRNGRPGSWKLGWTPSGFQHMEETAADTNVHPTTTRYA